MNGLDPVLLILRRVHLSSYILSHGRNLVNRVLPEPEDASRMFLIHLEYSRYIFELA